MWSFLARDRTFQLATAIFLAALLPYAVPVLSAETMEAYGTYYIDFILIGATLLALCFRCGNVTQTKRRRRFWTFIILSLLSHLAVRLIYVLVPDSAWEATVLWKIAASGTFLLAYVWMVLAIQINHAAELTETATVRLRSLRMAAGVLFLFGMYVYFALIPEQIGDNDAWVPSFYLYIGLDVYLLSYFAGSRLTKTGPWKYSYRWLAAWAGLLLAADLLEFLMYTGAVGDVATGKPLDIVWALPYAGIILAARTRLVPSVVNSPMPERSIAPWIGPLRAIWQRPILAYAFTLPLLHLSLYAGGLLDPDMRSARDVATALTLLVLGGLAVAYQKALEGQKEKADSTLKEYVRLEELIAELSTNFINLDPAEIEDGVDDALARLGEFAGVDRSFVFRFIEERKYAECLHEWCAPGIEQQLHDLQRIPVDEFPWLFEKILQCETVHVPDIGRLPAEAEAIKREATREGTLSLINVPMVRSGHVLGFVGFDSVHVKKEWSPQAIKLLGLVGDMVANALDRKASTDEREMLEAQLRQSQKIEALGTLAGGIAHDFNNMLQPILGYSEMALEEIEDPGTREHVEQVHTAATRARELTRQILAFSRQEQSLEFESVKIDPLVNEALNLLRAALPATIVIDKQVEDPGLELWANPTQIHQIVMNLGTNAAHSMRAGGGTLGFAARELDIDPAWGARLNVEPGRFIEFSVSDTGEGMDSQIVQKIFDPFFTTKGPDEGTGLGLSAVLGIARGHGGAVDVRSRPGEGTVVYVFLPMSAPTERIRQPVAKPRAGGSERILFVDDEVDVRRLGNVLLGRIGYEVVTAANGKEAVELFTRSPDHFDLIVTDVTMPVMTGIDLARAVRKIRPDFPIILTTGFSESITESVMSELNLQGFIFKPYKAAEMRKVVREALDGPDEIQSPESATGQRARSEDPVRWPSSP